MSENMLENKDSDNSLSSGAVTAIACVVTFIVSVTATAIISSIVTYYICVRRKFKAVYNPQHQSQQEKVLYEQVGPSSHTITKKDLELQANPAYGTSHNKVIMDTNPAYESCK